MIDGRINNETLKRLAEKEEPRFLSILLKDKDCLSECISYGMKPGPKGHFWGTESRLLFGIIHRYFQKYGETLSRTSIESIMDGQDSFNGNNITESDRASMRMYYDKVFAIMSDKKDFKFLMEQINNRFLQWQAYDILSKQVTEIAKATNNQTSLVKNIQSEFGKIQGIDPDPYTMTLNFSDGMDKVLQYIHQQRETPQNNQVVFTQLKTIDDILCGLEYGSYTVITGMINGGKTTLMFNIGFNMAKAGYSVVYVSLEKKAIPFYTRLLSLHSLVDYNKIKRGGKGINGIDETTYSILCNSAKDLKERIKPKMECIQMAQGTKLSRLLAEVDKIRSNKKIDVLIVDYLGVVGNETVTIGRPDLDEAMTSQRLQAYGRINNIVTITAGQLKVASSKDIRGKAKKASAEEFSNVEVNTEDLGGSKMVGADADFILGVVLNSDSPPTKMFIYTTKARDAESRRTVCVDFDGKLGKISDPILQDGQIKDLDELLYNKELDTKLLKDDLFSDNKEAKSAYENAQEQQEKLINKKENDIVEEKINDLEIINSLAKEAKESKDCILNTKTENLDKNTNDLFDE